MSEQPKLPLQSPSPETMADPLFSLIYMVLRKNATRCCDDTEDRLVLAEALLTMLREHGRAGG